MYISILHSHIVNQLTNTLGSVQERPNDILVNWKLQDATFGDVTCSSLSNVV